MLHTFEHKDQGLFWDQHGCSLIIKEDGYGYTRFKGRNQIWSPEQIKWATQRGKITIEEDE